MAQEGEIWTIGHSTRPAAGFIALLKANQIELIADVRRYPASRRHPQYNREDLARTLAESGIGYAHFPGLGGRREPDPGSANTGWPETGFRGYADYMATAAFEESMASLRTVASAQRTAMMCAEKDWRSCHRGLISDYLKVRTIEVVHILESGNTESHPYTKPARIRDGRLSYFAEGPFQQQLDL